MKKTVGTFTGTLNEPNEALPHWCKINDGTGDAIMFKRQDIEDLIYLLESMKVAGRENIRRQEKEGAKE